MEAATLSEQQEGPPLSSDATTAAGQRSKFFQKSSSFFSRSSPDPASDSSSRLSVAGLSNWAKSFKLPTAASKDSNGEAKDSKSTLSVLTSGFSKRNATKIPVVDEVAPAPSATPTPVPEGAFGTLTRGFLDSSRNAVKVVQTRARHLVSQNKRRYQEGGFDLDMTYITDSIIAMGFPAGDMSSGLFGYVEGFYRNHMEEVIKFFETHHKGKYKVYNLCSERLYDVSLLASKVASFPFDDHNCPPLQLVMAFCRSAYSWLKEDLENVVVVHCKAGMARTGLMISCLLLYLKFWPTAEECITNYNERRCIDGKGLVLPSQLRYVKYFERVLKEFNGETPSGRKCILRGIRLHRCPYWIRPAITISDHNGVLFSTKKHPRTKDMMSDDFWFAAPRKGVMVFALPGERCVADLDGDFKVHFHDRNGDFYCWLNTNMMEARQLLNTSDLDGFQKRRLPSPGFQVEIVTLDENSSAPAPKPQPEAGAAVPKPPPEAATSTGKPTADSKDNDDVFSDSESEEGSVKGRRQKKEKASSGSGDQAGDKEAAQVRSQEMTAATKPSEKDDTASDYVHVKEPAGSVSATAASAGSSDTGNKPEGEHNDFRAIAADASIFTFGDEDDDDSEG